MLETETHIYLEMPKTGSTTVRKTVAKNCVIVSDNGHHGTLDIPTDKIIVGSIRHPLDWYLSYWSWSCYMGSQYKGFQHLHRNITCAKSFRTWLREIEIEEVRPFGPWGWTEPSLYQQLFKDMHGDHEVEFLHTETLQDDMDRVFGPMEHFNFKFNETGRDLPREHYYTEEDLEFIHVRDGQFAEQFGYTTWMN